MSRSPLAPIYGAHANDEMLAFAMIETAEGMSNLSSIAATPGLDGLYVGPADLTLGLAQGRLAPGFDREEPEMIAALKEILAACKANGIRAALHCGTPEYAARAIEWGFDMTTVSGEIQASRRSGGGQRDEVPATDWPRRFEVRKGSLLMPHLLIAGKLHPEGLALLEGDDGFTFDYVVEVLPRGELRPLHRQSRCVGHPHPAAVFCTIAQASRLKIVSRHGVGYDLADVAALNKRRISLCIVGDVNSPSVADPAIMLILACEKQVIRADRAVRSGPGGGATGWRPAKFRASVCSSSDTVAADVIWRGWRQAS